MKFNLQQKLRLEIDLSSRYMHIYIQLNDFVKYSSKIQYKYRTKNHQQQLKVVLGKQNQQKYYDSTSKSAGEDGAKPQISQTKKLINEKLYRGQEVEKETYGRVEADD